MSSAYTGASACRGELELHQDLAQAGQVQIRAWQVHLALKGQYNVRRYILVITTLSRSVYWAVGRVATLL